MAVDYRDIVTRAVKTFLQAFLSTLGAGLIVVDSWSALQSLLFASLVAGGAALASFVQNWIKETL